MKIILYLILTAVGWLLVTQFKAGALTSTSAWILGVTCVVEVWIITFLLDQFSIFEDDLRNGRRVR